jgi:Fis family transcriptional regulator, factor for inversion stimulation protein
MWGKNVTSRNKALKSKNNSLQKSVSSALIEYLSDLDGEDPCNLYETILNEIEKPLLTTVMSHCENNQSRAASCLGINRGTLRKKLKQHHITQ